MKKIYLFILLFSFSFVHAGFYEDFFNNFDGPILNVKLEQQLLFSNPFDNLNVNNNYIPVTKVEFISSNQALFVKITDSGFEPKEIEISSGQTIIWKNERNKVGSLVYGVREISDMKSDFIKSGEEFNWTFDKKGEFTYVDAVMIGRVGKVIVG